MDNSKSQELATAPIGSLLMKFIIPAATGVIVGALYNIVDRVFVGQGVGEIAFGSLSIASPIMLVIVAVSMLFGMGSANFISILLGQKQPEKAGKVLTQCFVLQVVSGLIITVAGLVFLEPLLIVFGAKPGTEAIVYAQEYMRIIFYGTVFNMISFGMSHGTRAQGFNTITMIIMLLGAVINLILDPLFIFVFRMGVAGAAYATIIAQFISCAVAMYYVVIKKGVIHISFKGFKFSAEIFNKIIKFGFAQFAVQFAVSVVSVVYNACLMKYGEAYFNSPSGGDMALAGFGVTLTFSQLVLMPVLGITQGAQPILGFNYGAGQYGRVRKAFIYSVLSATGLVILGFIIIMLFPYQLAGIFSKEKTPEIIGFAVKSIRWSMICLPLVGFQIVSANYFTVIGKSAQSIILSLSRQCFILIPAIIILSQIWGLGGVIMATPVADGLSFLITGIMIYFELKKLRGDRSDSVAA